MNPMNQVLSVDFINVFGSLLNVISFYMIPAAPIALILIWFLIVNWDQDQSEKSADLAP